MRGAAFSRQRVKTKNVRTDRFRPRKCAGYLKQNLFTKNFNSLAGNINSFIGRRSCPEKIIFNRELSMETGKGSQNNNKDINTEEQNLNTGKAEFKSELGKHETVSRKTSYDSPFETVFIKSVDSVRDDGKQGITAGRDDTKCNAEEPMDLTFSQGSAKSQNHSASSSSAKNNTGNKLLSDGQIYDEAKSNATFTIAKIVQADHLIANANVPKKRGRKRKENAELRTKRCENPSPTFDNPDYVQTTDSRQAEVLMAAKSLFSKRTRTLYHWMYPNTPKAQLKSAVSMSWETLGVQEKEFYISQVLGRFGFPQSSLMVNPQLGGLKGVPILPPLDLSNPLHVSLETHHAVSTILDDRENSNGEGGATWSQYGYPLPHTKRINRKRVGLGRPPGSKSQKHHLEEQNVGVKPVAVESVNDDFQDDPELRQEFEQFKWALNMSGK